MGWNSYAIDTIEYVYNLPGKNTGYLISDRTLYPSPQLRDTLKGRYVRELPQAYHAHPDLDWFHGADQ